MEPGATAAFVLETNELAGVDWARLHVAAFAEYRPVGSSESYDMLQAATALPPDLRVVPQALVFLVDPADSSSPSAALSLRGPSHLTWAADENLPWLDVSPDSAPLLNSPTVSVIPSSLASGWQQGIINFTANGDGLSLNRQLPVQVYYGQLSRTYLPVIGRSK